MNFNVLKKQRRKVLLMRATYCACVPNTHLTTGINRFVRLLIATPSITEPSGGRAEYVSKVGVA